MADLSLLKQQSMNAVLLFARSRHDSDKDSDKDSKKICPQENTTGPPLVPFVGNLSFHSFATILTGASAVFCFLAIAIAISRHAFNYTNRIQQRQVIRIILLVPWVSLFCFLMVWQEEAGEYLVGSLDFGCAIALSAFLLLMCDYVLASPGGYQSLLGDDPGRPKEKTQGLAWFKRVWYMSLQFIPTSLILWVVTCITLASDTYCAASNSPHFAHIWITVIKGVVTVWAVLADFRLYKQQKAVLKPHNMLLKFAAFKGIIGLNVIQTLIINILLGSSVIRPTQHLTYEDIKVGLPNLILGLEMPLFSILIIFAFPVSPYQKRGDGSATPAAGPLVAVVEALNITDLLSCFVRGPMRLVRDQQWGIMRQQSMPLEGGGGKAHRGSGRRSHSRNGRRSHSRGGRRDPWV